MAQTFTLQNTAKVHQNMPKRIKRHMNPDTYCILPFNHLSIDPVGHVRPCCNYDIHSKTFKESGVPMDKVQDVDNPMDNLWHKQLREDIKDGKRHSLCKRCWTVEDNGGFSYRQNYNQWFMDPKSDMYMGYTEPPTEIKIEYVEMTLGNKCNIQCRMCNPWSSSMWQEDMVHHPQLDFWRTKYDNLTFDWYESDRFEKILTDILPTVKHINFLGGEPLFNEKYYQIMERIMQSGRAEEISIQFNTNGLAIQDKSKESWNQLKKVGFNLSCDGIGAVNEYVRWPGKWSKWERNMNKLKTWRKELGKINWENIQESKWTFQFHSTMSSLTWLNFPDLLRYTAKFDGHSGLFPFAIQVTQPEYMDPIHMPDEIKEKGYKAITETIAEVKTQAKPWHWVDSKNIEGLMNHIMNTPRDESLWEQMIFESNKLDRIRNSCILDIVPEFKDYWHDANVPL